MKFRSTKRHCTSVKRDLEKFLIDAPAKSLAEAGAKARYVILLFARTAEAQDARRQKLIACVLDDLARLTE